MKNYTAFILSITIVIALAIGFSSCKEDEPPTPPKLSFAESSMTVNEDDGVIEVELVLDKAYGKDLTIEFDLDGTAKDQLAVGTATADYEVQGDHDVVVIESGETSGIIELEIFNDVAFEQDETIEISITDINTSDVELTADDEIEITITNDDEQLGLSFANASMTVSEADEAVEVQLVLDKAAPQNITIHYELSGSATDSLTAWTEEISPDYYINGVSGTLVIQAGQTSGIIDIRLFSDLFIEDSNLNTGPFDPETIIITVTDASGIEMAENELEISLKQEDGLVVLLTWPDPVGAQQADMDLLLRVGPNTSSWLGILTGSAQEEFTGPEFVFIPTAINFQAFGLSHVYWDGTLDPLAFEVVFIDLINGALEPEPDSQTFQATYTAANKNKWTDPLTTLVVQTFEKSGESFTEPTAITVPAAGSRVRTGDNFISTFKKSDSFPNRNLYTLLKKYNRNQIN